MLATRTRHAKNLWLVGIQQVQHSQPRDRQLRADGLYGHCRNNGSLYSLTQCWSGDTTPKHPAPALWLKTRLRAYCKILTELRQLWPEIHDRCKAKALKFWRQNQAYRLFLSPNEIIYVAVTYFYILIRIWSPSRTRQVSTHKGALRWWPWKQSRS